MKAIKFAKIFEVDDAQISFKKDNDTESDLQLIIAEIVVDHDNLLITPSLKLKFKDEDARNKKFDELTQEIAADLFYKLLEEVKDALN